MAESAAAQVVWRDARQPLEARVEALLSQLSLEEKIALTAGAGAFTLTGVARLGVPDVRISDGPTGVRSNEGEAATVFPVGVALASTWNPELVREVAGAIAREALALDVHVILAPTVNIMRTPLWGRNFETYSEDPFLTAAIGAAYVDGLQAHGVGASLKHYAANNQEANRMSVDVVVDERTLREIYLAAFETIVKATNPWTVMASYNRLDGAHATENRRLLTDILKGEWGYDGVVVSDWGAVHSTAPAMNAGNDLEMPGPALWFGDKLAAAVAAGEVAPARIDDAARRLLRLILRTGAVDGGARPAGELRSLRHRQTAARAAEEAMVLLKNDGDLLPLNTGELKSVAVVGPNAAARRIQGGGSSHVRPGRQTSVLRAIEELLAGQTEVRFAEGGDHEPVPPAARAAQFSADEARAEPGLEVAWHARRDFSGEPLARRVERRIGGMVNARAVERGGETLAAMRWSGWFWPERDGHHEFALRAPGEARLILDGEVLIDASTPGEPDRWDLFAQDWPRRIAGAELVAGRGTPIVIEYLRPQGAAPAWESVTVGVRAPTGSIQEAAELAADCDAAVVVVGAASITEGEGYDRPDLELPGEQNRLVEAVLAANRRTVVVLVGGAPYALPWIDHAPAVLAAWLGGEEGPDAAARILFGRAEPSGRLPVTFPRRLEDTPAHAWYPGDAQAVYGEGLFVGYRHYDRAPTAPLFAFGHGLTYTRFAYSDLTAPQEAGPRESVEVEFTLANTGQRPGRETAQLYVRPRGPSVERPVKELKGFAKVELAPGERRRVRLSLASRDFAFWDVAAGAWRTEPGAYDLLVGASAAEIELQATIRIRP